MHIPSLTRYAELARLLLKQEDVSLPEVAALVRHDPPLTARLLRGVNSAAYSLSEPICDPAHAASVLGVKGLRNLIMRAPTFDDKRTYRETGYDVNVMWEDSADISALCGLMTKKIKVARQFDAEEMEIHGLLCDIGRYAMFDGLGNQFAEACLRAREEKRSLSSVEKECFGFSHNELGAMLVKRWSLPEDFVKTTRFHHNESRLAESDPMVAVVYLASAITERKLKPDDHSERVIPKRVDLLLKEIPKLIQDHLDLDGEILEEFLRFLYGRATEKRAA